MKVPNRHLEPVTDSDSDRVLAPPSIDKELEEYNCDIKPIRCRIVQLKSKYICPQQVDVKTNKLLRFSCATAPKLLMSVFVESLSKKAPPTVFLTAQQMYSAQ